MSALEIVLVVLIVLAEVVALIALGALWCWLVKRAIERASTHRRTHTRPFRHGGDR